MKKSVFFRRPVVVWLGVLLLCLVWNYCFFLRPAPHREQAYIFGWDDNLYFAWCRSLALDGDLDFANDFDFVAHWKGAGPTQEVFAEFMGRGERTPAGRVPNITGCGFGFMALPLEFVSRGMAATFSMVTGTAVSPFASIYCLAFIFTSILLSFAGLAITFRILRERFGEPAAFRAIVVGMLGLATGYYIWFELTMAHAVEFGVSAFFVALMLRWHSAVLAEEVSPRRVLLGALWMGVMLGVCCMTRFPAIALSAAPTVLGLRAAWRRRDRIPLISGSAVAAAVGAIIGFLPQMISWKYLYGAWFVNSYDVTVRFRPIDVWNVFFDSRIGLFLWTPLAALALAGLIVGARRGDDLCIAMSAVFLIFLWEFSSCDLFIPGGPGHAFGMRYFVDGAFLFFLGLAVVFQWLGTLKLESWARRTLLSVVVALIAWNLYFETCYRAQIQPHGEPMAFGLLFGDWQKWRGQFMEDINLPKRLFQKRFPLFTRL
ncbi:MAG: hypothetical protein K1X53_14480 [Candidatus Sumerlaeaceae bacterium]|nr:hypothetical protein [Candidatus Sumerlaeaceae bacterium]